MSNTFLDTVISGTIASGVELMDAVVLNGQVHNKSTLAPRPLQFLGMPSQSSEFYANHMLFYQGIATTANLDIKDNLFLDAYDPGTYYFVRQAPRSSALRPVLVKVSQKSDKTYDIQERPFGSTNNTIVHYLSQDAQFVYVSEMIGSDQFVIHRLNKDFTTENIARSAANYISGNIVKYTEDASSATLIVPRGSTTTSIIAFVFNKTTGVVSKVSELQASETNLSTVTPNIGITDPTSDGRCYFPNREPETGAIGLGMLKMDTQTNKLTCKQVNLVVPGEARLGFDRLVFSGCWARARYFTEDSREYVSVITHLSSASYTSTDTSIPKMYIFELTSSTEGILRQTIDFDSWYNGSLTINNNKTVFCINSSEVAIYSWDSTDRKMEKTYSLSTSPYQLAVDKLNNVYIVNNDRTVVYRLSQGIPAGVAKVEFDKVNYTLAIGEKIPTKISVSLKNYMGKYLGRNVQVNLYGNCEFEDGTSETVVVTDPNGPIEKLVYITGPGDLQAVPILI